VPEKKILVVDDEADTREMLDKLLSGEGFRVSCSDGPADALEQVKRVQPDLIVLDLRMPRMSGIDLLPRLQFCVPHARIMILSAYADHDTAQRALDQGAAGVLWKPFKPSTLLQMIARILDLPPLSKRKS
jgi:CheY-like chemotaxis protein